MQRKKFSRNTAANVYPYDLAVFAQEVEELGWVKGSDGIY